MSDSVRSPFQRLLTDAKHGGQAKVDALVALAQRTVFIATWGQGHDPSFRTLTNANGQTALPIFSDEAELRRAAAQFGWAAADGSVSWKEIGARGAFNYAVGHNLHFVVIDITAPHSLDIGREELEPLLTPAARRESSGPYAGVGRISSSMMAAVKPSSASEPPVIAAAKRTASEEPGPVTTFGGGSSIEVHKLNDAPSDALLGALVTVLRGYPEVEWAALCAISRGPGAPNPTAALKVDAAFRQRVGEIVHGLREAATAEGASIDVLLLDDPAIMRTVRSNALLFYPWKR